MNPNSDIGTSSKNRQEVSKQRKTRNSDSGQQGEIFAKSNLSELRVGQSDANNSSSQMGSLTGSEKSFDGMLRDSTLNRENKESMNQQATPFEHSYLYPMPLQKVISGPQNTSGFIIEEAISHLSVPNNTLYQRDLEKMHLLALIQEKKIENTLLGASKTNLPLLTIKHKNPVSNAMQMEEENQINFNERDHIPSTSKYVQVNQQDNLAHESINFQDNAQQNPPMRSLDLSFGMLDQRMRIEEESKESNYRDNFNSQQGYSNDYSNQQLQYANFMDLQPNQSNVYPQSDVQMLSPSQQYMHPSEEVQHHQNWHTTYNNQEYQAVSHSNFQENATSRPSHFSANLRKETNSNLAAFVDQQFARINSFLVQRSSPLPGSTPADSPTRSISTFSFEPLVINLARSPRSDYNSNLSLSSANFNTNLAVSQGQPTKDGLNAQNAILIDDTNTTNPSIPSKVPVKSNRKNFSRTNTDPTKVESLIRAIDPTLQFPNSVFNSKTPSSGGNNQSFTSLSQFSGMNQECSPIGSLTNLSGNIPSGLPSIDLKAPKNTRAFLQDLDSTSQVLVESLPSQQKKKIPAFARSKTDPKKLDELAMNIISSGIPFYNRDSGSITRNGCSTEDHDSSGVLEINKSSTDILNEPMEKLMLKSDHSDKSASLKQFGSTINPTNSFQPASTHTFNYEATFKSTGPQSNQDFFNNSNLNNNIISLSNQINQDSLPNQPEIESFFNPQPGTKL